MTNILSFSSFLLPSQFSAFCLHLPEAWSGSVLSMARPHSLPYLERLSIFMLMSEMFQQRHKSDNTVNNRKSYVVRGGELVEEKWQNVRVGDVIKMESDNFVAVSL